LVLEASWQPDVAHLVEINVAISPEKVTVLQLICIFPSSPPLLFFLQETANTNSDITDTTIYFLILINFAFKALTNIRHHLLALRCLALTEPVCALLEREIF
jgi:hypothetical protein